MASEIDNDLLIRLVQQRPLLWDRTAAGYKHRDKTVQSWKQICRLLIDGFDGISEKEENEIGRYVKKRWTNIKDSFLRWHKKSNDAIRSGASGGLKKYVYHDQLLFLKKDVVPKSEIEDSLDDSLTIYEEEESIDYEEPETKKYKIDEPEIQSEPKRKDIQMPEFEERMISAYEATPTSSYQSFKDRHMAFFAGIVPSLENFNEDQICDFQIGVLQLIQSLKRREISIPANNTYQRNDNFDFGQATP